MTVVMVALPVVFQPELRRALEQIGRGRLFHKHNELDEKELEDMLNAVTNATEIMSRRKIGALMVFERETGLEERIETGVPIDGLISDSLLLNIFEPDTPLHDGAVVIRGNRIVAASCLLPLTEARNLSQELGTRHRSAIGISEQSDALVLVVSEETGTISLARNGELHRYLTGEDIKSLLRAAVVQPSLNWKQVINDKIKRDSGWQMMGNFFDRENMLARVIAFLIACALWMYVMNEQNPLVERNYVVNLELRNVPEGMIVLNTPDKVRVKVQAQRTVLGDITEKEVTAYVDFADKNIGQQALPVKAQFNQGTVLEVYPNNIYAYLDSVTER